MDMNTVNIPEITVKKPKFIIRQDGQGYVNMDEQIDDLTTLDYSMLRYQTTLPSVRSGGEI